MNTQTIVTIVCSIFASSGLWAFIMMIYDKKTKKREAEREKKDVRTKMLLGLGHDKIMELGMRYIERGGITQSEYENLYKYLYEPYKEMGGNGSAERVMREVSNLKIIPDSYSN